RCCAQSPPTPHPNTMRRTSMSSQLNAVGSPRSLPTPPRFGRARTITDLLRWIPDGRVVRRCRPGSCAAAMILRIRSELGWRLMSARVIASVAVVIVVSVLVGMGLRPVQQYQRGVVLRFGRLLPAVREPGLRVIVPFVDVMRRVPVQTIV